MNLQVKIICTTLDSGADAWYCDIHQDKLNAFLKTIESKNITKTDTLLLPRCIITTITYVVFQ
jgi:hypothetical protein